MDDADFWHTTDPKDLWLFDKLILARKLGYICGPAGVAPPLPGVYIVRPCVNYRMMSRGAQFLFLTPDNHSAVPDGYFWCESFSGRHLSFDYHYGHQTLAVEGFRSDHQQLDRFCSWQKVADSYQLPPVLQSIAHRYQWLNIEVVGDNIIEAHLRFNDDFANHDASKIMPVWRDQFYSSACGDRLGFILQ